LAWGINRDGDLVGRSIHPEGFRATLWTRE
jgi:hypothetical protein